MQRLVIVVALVSLTALIVAALGVLPFGREQSPANVLGNSESRSLDGDANNVVHPEWGVASTEFLRVVRPRYADKVGSMVNGPPARYVSNRIFNDVGQNLFSENDVSQWGWAWGQFIDHDISLGDETPGESAPIAFNTDDPLESFTNDLGNIRFTRTPAAPGTGTSLPRQQINTISSYIDSSNAYGVTPARLDWLREGPVDGNPTNNGPRLMLNAGYLPRVGARGDQASAPPMDLVGALEGTPGMAVVAGDVRANENIALTAIHTLMAREHNRIVAALPSSLPADVRFQLARRVVIAEEQFITYREFLPALGVKLDPYGGYAPQINAGLANEFAVVGYRAHSMVPDDFEPVVRPNTYSKRRLAAFEREGIGVEAAGGGRVKLRIPLTVGFGNPGLIPVLGLGTMLQSLGTKREYRNDEMIDDSLRSVLFQVPRQGISDPRVCGKPGLDTDCFSGVVDLGATDVERGRDHGMPTYNQLRVAYGLPPRRSFTEITGERTELFPRDLAIDRADPIDDPNILDFVLLRDRNGRVIPTGSDRAQLQAVTGVRRTTLAARLKAIYGEVDRLDAFVGMMSERHVQGSEFGELQLAIWRRQFEALRDGDRFFYLNDPVLERIRTAFGIDYRHKLSELVKLNAGVAVQPNVFKARDVRITGSRGVSG